MADYGLKTIATQNIQVMSLVTPAGQMVPSVIAVISDAEELYDEPEVLNTLLSDKAYMPLEVVNVETYNQALIAVTVTNASLNYAYNINIPRALLQVGNVLNKTLDLPLLGIISDKELEAYTTDNALTPYLSLDYNDIHLTVDYPEDLSEEDEDRYSEVLGVVETNYLLALSEKESTPLKNDRVKITATPDEVLEAKGEALIIMMELLAGKIEGLDRLYGYADRCDTVFEKAKERQPFNDDDRHALLLNQSIDTLFLTTDPDNIRDRISISHEDGSDVSLEEIAEKLQYLNTPESANSDNDDDDMNNVIAQLFSPFGTTHQKNDTQPEPIDPTEVDTTVIFKAYMELLTYGSDQLSFPHGLKTLHEHLNLEQLLAKDWNVHALKDEKGISQGEALIIKAIISLQRIILLAEIHSSEDTYDVAEPSVFQFIAGFLSDADDDSWVLNEGVRRLNEGDQYLLKQYLRFADDAVGEVLDDMYFEEMEDADDEVDEDAMDEEKEILLQKTPTFILLHWLGHVIASDSSWLSEEKMMIATKNMTIMNDFTKGVLAWAQAQPENFIESLHSTTNPTPCEIQAHTLEFVVDHFDGETSEVLQGELVDLICIFARMYASSKGAEPNSEKWVILVDTFLTSMFI